MVKATPQQKRSQETHEKIIRAARGLLAKKGYQDMNTNMIAREAGVGVGSFYHHFEDKKDVVLSILQENVERVSDGALGVATRMDSTDSDGERMRGLIEVLMEFHKKDARVNRAIEEMKYIDPDIERYFENAMRGLRDLVEVMLKGLEKRRGVEVGDLKVKARILVSIIESLCHENYYYGLGLSDEELMDEMEELILGYIFMSLDMEGQRKYAQELVDSRS